LTDGVMADKGWVYAVPSARRRDARVATRNTIDYAQTVNDVAWLRAVVHAIDAVA
jgi:hypothetical protein